ncbi:unnamed protein product [Vitrella brassicaformis CCMP3155]|uniref:Uncharacterized protein n=3 Tax=Vitrella brassicaformis TaxID=1169539 RepID=A0A0G4EFR5_VITBC|nr:unnamed protein product [Vitrella brassicaformis CCMP3155]|eukprot:CEL95381.1 unnamed protein product [Vitrella brassicaformis CCMP3155]
MMSIVALSDKSRSPPQSHNTTPHFGRRGFIADASAAPAPSAAAGARLSPPTGDRSLPQPNSPLSSSVSSSSALHGGTKSSRHHQLVYSMDTINALQSVTQELRSAREALETARCRADDNAKEAERHRTAAGEATNALNETKVELQRLLGDRDKAEMDAAQLKQDNERLQKALDEHQAASEEQRNSTGHSLDCLRDSLAQMEQELAVKSKSLQTSVRRLASQFRRLQSAAPPDTPLGSSVDQWVKEILSGLQHLLNIWSLEPSQGQTTDDKGSAGAGAGGGGDGDGSLEEQTQKLLQALTSLQAAAQISEERGRRCKELEERCRSLEQQLCHLTDDADKVRHADSETLKKQLEELRSQIHSQFTQMKDRLEAEVSSAREAIAAKTAEAQEMTNQKNQADEARKKFEEDLSDVRRQLEASQGEKQKLRVDIAERLKQTEKSATQLQTKVRELQRQKTDAVSTNTSLQRELRSMAAQLTERTSIQDKLNARIRDLQARLHRAEANERSRVKQLRDAERQARQLQQEATQKIEQLQATLEAERATQAARIDELSETVFTQARTIDTQRELATTLQAALQATRQHTQTPEEPAYTEPPLDPPPHAPTPHFGAPLELDDGTGGALSCSLMDDPPAAGGDSIEINPAIEEGHAAEGEGGGSEELIIEGQQHVAAEGPEPILFHGRAYATLCLDNHHPEGGQEEEEQQHQPPPSPICRPSDELPMQPRPLPSLNPSAANSISRPSSRAGSATHPPSPTVARPKAQQTSQQSLTGRKVIGGTSQIAVRPKGSRPPSVKSAVSAAGGAGGRGLVRGSPTKGKSVGVGVGRGKALHMAGVTVSSRGPGVQQQQHQHQQPLLRGYGGGGGDIEEDLQALLTNVQGVRQTLQITARFDD